MITLSMLDANDFYETAVLDGEQYNLHFAYNARAKTWTLDIRTSENADIVRGIPMVPNFPLLHQYRRHVGLPQGELIAVITSPVARNELIGRKDFIRGRATLVYIPEEELNELMG